MANQESYDWHLQKMMDAQKRVGLIIQNGTKASNNAAIAYRMSHPSYKGLVDNSTGSKNMPFFLNKDESHIPLEHKIAQRTGGVLHTKAGQAYGHEILQRRARQVREQEAAERGELPVPSPTLTLTEEESKTLEFNNILQTINDAVEQNEVTMSLISELRNGTRLMISLAPTFTEADLTDIVRVCDNILEDIETLYDSVTDELQLNQPALARQQEAAIVMTEKFIKQLREVAVGMLKVVNRDLADRKIAAKSLGKEIFKISGIAERAKKSKAEEAIAETEAEPLPEEAPSAMASRQRVESLNEDANYVNQLFSSKAKSNRAILHRIFENTFPKRDPSVWSDAKMRNALLKHSAEGKPIKR